MFMYFQLEAVQNKIALLQADLYQTGLYLDIQYGRKVSDTF